MCGLTAVQEAFHFPSGGARRGRDRELAFAGSVWRAKAGRECTSDKHKEAAFEAGALLRQEGGSRFEDESERGLAAREGLCARVFALK